MSNRGGVLATAWLAGCLLCSTVAAAASAERFTVDRRALMTWFGDPQISPDGKRILYVQERTVAPRGDLEAGLWLMESDGSSVRRVADAGEYRWAPDSARFAYVSSAPDGSSQVFLRATGAAQGIQLTREARDPRMLSWSPDGRQIAFIALVPREAIWSFGMTLPEGIEAGPAPSIVDDLHFRQSGSGELTPGYEHLFVVSVQSGEVRQLTHGDWHVGGRETGRVNLRSYGFSWTPDGRRILIDGLRSADHDLRSLESRLYLVSLNDGSLREIPTAGKGMWISPRAAPSGRQIAYHGYPSRSDGGESPLALWVARADGSAARNLSAEMEEDAEGFFWSTPEHGLFFNAAKNGLRGVWFAPLGGKARRIIQPDRQDLSITSVAANGMAVGLLGGYDAPPEIVRVSLRPPYRITRLTHANGPVVAGIDLGAVEDFWLRTPDGLALQAWVFHPPGFDPSKRYPVVTYLHGGPRYMGNPVLDWSGMFSIRALAAAGYVVLYPGYRGNVGYGAAVSAAANRSFPGDTVGGDVLQALDELSRRGFIDPKRQFLVGESAGGSLAAWLIGQTGRFAAAVVLWPTVDWISGSLTADDLLSTFRRVGEPFWQDPAPWIAQSPLFSVGRMSTPILLMTGVDDLRTPIRQTEEFFAALKIAGQAPVRMVRFAGEGHGYPVRVANFVRLQHYLESWLAEHDAGISPIARDERVSRSRERARTVLKTSRLPGLSIAVSRDGGVVWAEGFGYADLEHGVPVTPGTQLRIASISKSLTATLMARLRERGLLDLDVPVQRYVPDFPDQGAPITLRQLAAHRSGLAHYTDADLVNATRYADMTAALAKFRDRPLESLPGTKFRYSSFGYNLIGAAVEGVTHEPFVAVMAREITGPLGLSRTVPDEHDRIIPGRTAFYTRHADEEPSNAPAVDNSDVWPAGGYLSTASDLVRFGHAVVEGSFLTPASRELLLSPVPENVSQGESFGLGWQVEKRDGLSIVGHDGSHVGCMARLRVYRGTGVAVAVLVNLSIESENEVERALDELVHATALEFIAAPSPASGPSAIPPSP